MDSPVEAEGFECRTCGACCMDAGDGHVLVSAEDLLRWRREDRADVLDGLVDGHFGQRAFAARESGHCVHLGAATGRLDCAIYPTRGAACRQVQPGDRQCIEYRRRFFDVRQ